MRRITIYLNDELAAEVRRRASGNVSAYVAELLAWDVRGRRFDEGLALLAQLPAAPDEEPLTDRASVLRAVEERRRPWASGSTAAGNGPEVDTPGGGRPGGASR